ncbi:MAG TPA: FAD-binding oxidoreductase [Chitinophagaceae bacterium]|jgi:Flavodoxin reductases (ferredoxin-NADPH reductases) family 1
MALQPWRNGKVIRIENETHNTKRFWIQVSEVEDFNFKPGQFVTVDLPIDEKPARRWRSYSIASWPDGTNIFELIIVLLPEGKGSNYFFNKISVESEIIFRGPLGVFVLPEILDKQLFFICTGTGIAPFRSMIHYLKLNNIPRQNIYLIFGCRTQKDLLYHEELCDLMEELEKFNYIPTLSRQEWNGRSGYVHILYEELCKEKPDALFYLCGWKDMIEEAKKRILALGYDRKAIRQELYG